MSSTYTPEIFEIRDGASVNRLVLRVNSLNELGESVGQPQGRSLGQVTVEGIIGSPEGRSLGMPGDVRVRQDVPQIWQKQSGFRTRTGWVLIGSGGGGSGIEVELNGVPLGVTSTLNFTGNVAVTVQSNRIDIQIPTWEEVYYMDVADQATADLNAPGSSTVIDGVTWRTFAAATTGVNMVPATGSFGIVNGTGQQVVGAANARCNATTMTANFMYTSLAELAANSRTPFAGDPHAEYIIQARIASANPDATSEWSGVMICRFGQTLSESGNLFGNATTWRCGTGFYDGTADRLLGTGGPGVAPPVTYYRPSSLTPALPLIDTPHIHYANPQAVQFGGSNSVGGVMQDPGSGFQSYVTSRDPTDHEVDIVLHPIYGWFVGFGHCAENLSNTYNAVIDAFRILQK